MKTVSVHIVTYNSASDILECLQGVASQSYPISKVIVIDNASTDHTVDVLRSYSGPLLDQLQICPNQQNSGFAPGHNQAIKLSTSDYVLVLNPDVTLEPNYIASLIKAMEECPKTGSATGRLLLKSEPSTIDSTGLVMDKTYRAFDRGAGETASNWEQSGEVFGVSGAAALYSRAMIEDISIDGEFYDNDFFAYKEDVDVAWRAQLLGWKSTYVADAIAYHERGWKKGSRRSQPLLIRRMSYINRYKMIYKNIDKLLTGRLLLHLFPYEVASHGYFLLREPQVLGAWGALFKNRESLKRKRQEIQRRKGRNRS